MKYQDEYWLRWPVDFINIGDHIKDRFTQKPVIVQYIDRPNRIIDAKDINGNDVHWQGTPGKPYMFDLYCGFRQAPTEHDYDELEEEILKEDDHEGQVFNPYTQQWTWL